MMILARTLWGEARGLGREGMYNVACVIRNRVYDERWPSDWEEVCLQRWQFSCWNFSDPNYFRVQNVTTEDKEFREAILLAFRFVHEKPADVTNGCNHYHSHAVEPYWAVGRDVDFQDEGHLFYRL